MYVKLTVDFILNGLAVKITQKVCGKTEVILTRRSTVFIKGTSKMCHSHPFLTTPNPFRSIYKLFWNNLLSNCISENLGK